MNNFKSEKCFRDERVFRNIFRKFFSDLFSNIE